MEECKGEGEVRTEGSCSWVRSCFVGVSVIAGGFKPLRGIRNYLYPNLTWDYAGEPLCRIKGGVTPYSVLRLWALVR